MKRFLLLLTDFKYFVLILLLYLLIIIIYLPLAFLSIFFKDKLTKAFVKNFSKVD